MVQKISIINPYVLNAPFLYPLKTVKPLSLGVEKRGRERVHWGEWVKVHGDDHYCAAIFHYLKEYNICFRKCAMTSTDDKNKIKVSEPN